jgi:hypothetical protein
MHILKSSVILKRIHTGNYNHTVINNPIQICESSQDQLCKMWNDEEEGEELMEQPQLPQNALHLYRLQEVLMKIVNSNRPQCIY